MPPLLSSARDKVFFAQGPVEGTAIICCRYEWHDDVSPSSPSSAFPKSTKNNTIRVAALLRKMIQLRNTADAGGDVRASRSKGSSPAGKTNPPSTGKTPVLVPLVALLDRGEKCLDVRAPCSELYLQGLRKVTGAEDSAVGEGEGREVWGRSFR